jgi:hypothetical protein
VNVLTGDIYEGASAIAKARERGEPVVDVSQRVADLVRAGHQYESLDPSVTSLAQRVSELEARFKTEDAKKRLEVLGFAFPQLGKEKTT